MLHARSAFATLLVLAALGAAPIAHAQPIARCQTSPVNAVLGAGGTVTIPPSLVDDGSGGASGRPVSLSVSPNMFSCSDIENNPHTVTLTVTGAGPADTCTAQVNVVAPPPSVTCQNISVNLDGAGMVSVLGADLVASATSACDGDPTITPTTADFTCADLGGNSVMVTATAGGQMATCMSTVTVVDNGTMTPPMITCGGTVTLPPSSDTLLTTTLTEPSASDNCGTPTISNDAPGAGFPLGDTTVTWTATDGSGNETSCMQTIRRDCCMPDMGMPDMGQPMMDAGAPMTDGGVPVNDAGTGATDQGANDADQGADGDQGTDADQDVIDVDLGSAAGSDAGPSETTGGSSCAAAPARAPGAPIGLLLVLGVLVLRRRR